MTVKLLTEHHFEFLRLKGGCRGLDVSTLVKMPHCWNFSCGGSISFETATVYFIVSLTNGNCTFSRRQQLTSVKS